MPDTYMPAAARTIFADRLAPCPFCGGEAEMLSASSEGPDAGAMFVQCGNGLCMASSALIFALMDDVKPLLIERWNRRAAGDVRRHIVCVCPDCARAGHPAEWRPIATAPMLGRAILLFWQYAGVMRGRYVSDERGEGWMCDGDQVIPTNQEDCTHWMPLPTAPAPTKPEFNWPTPEEFDKDQS